MLARVLQDTRPVARTVVSTTVQLQCIIVSIPKSSLIIFQLDSPEINQNTHSHPRLQEVYGSLGLAIALVLVHRTVDLGIEQADDVILQGIRGNGSGELQNKDG